MSEQHWKKENIQFYNACLESAGSISGKHWPQSEPTNKFEDLKVRHLIGKNELFSL